MADFNPTLSSGIPAGLRADLIGLAVVEPEALADAIDVVVREHPGITPALRRALCARLPTLSLQRPPSASVAAITFVASRRPPQIAQRPVRYRQGFTFRDQTVDLSLGSGEEGVMLGGTLVNLRAVAALLPRSGDETLWDEVLDAIAAAIVRDCLEPAPRKALRSRGRDLSSVLGDDDVFQVQNILTALWPGAADHPRHDTESLADHVHRLYECCHEAGATDPDATAALTAIRREFPQFEDWHLVGFGTPEETSEE